MGASVTTGLDASHQLRQVFLDSLIADPEPLSALWRTVRPLGGDLGQLAPYLSQQGKAVLSTPRSDNVPFFRKRTPPVEPGFKQSLVWRLDGQVCPRLVVAGN
jgi:hypothetical protein